MEIESQTGIAPDQRDGFHNHLEIIQRLQALIASLQSERSILTKVAELWGKRPAWQKNMLGVGLFGMVLTGILSHLSLLIVISATISLVYYGASTLLDEHFRKNQHSEAIYQTILALGETLVAVINDLQLISYNFQVQNEQLADTVIDLKDTVSQLKAQREAFELQLNQAERISASLADELERMEQLQSESAQQNAELQLAIDALKHVNSALNRAFNEISTVRITDKAQLDDFLNRFNNMMTNGFTELKNTIIDMKQNNQRHEEILNRQEKLLVQEASFWNELSKTVDPTPLKPTVNTSLTSSPRFFTISTDKETHREPELRRNASAY